MTSLSLSPRHFWRWLAYHHQAAEGSLYLMFFSGLLLWEPLTPVWSLARWNLLLHVMLSPVSYTHLTLPTKRIV